MIRRNATRIVGRACPLLLLIIGSCAPAVGYVRLRDNEKGSGSVDVPRLDCAIYQQRMEPLAHGGNDDPASQARWCASAEMLISTYVDLCHLHNAAAISLEAFRARLHQLDEAYLEALDIERLAARVPTQPAGRHPADPRIDEWAGPDSIAPDPSNPSEIISRRRSEIQAQITALRAEQPPPSQ
jgi:hypothetical protein